MYDEDGVDPEDLMEPVAPVAPDVAAVRHEALVAYHAAIHADGFSSTDPLVRAAALVRLADAKDAYRAAGGKPDSRYSDRNAHVFEEARALLAGGSDTVLVTDTADPTDTGLDAG